MAVAFDAVGPAGGGGASTLGAGPLTWAHVNSAAGNAILVGVNYRTGSSPEATAVSFGAASLSRIGTIAGGTGGSGGVDLWGKIGGLPTGSGTVSVTFSGGAGNATTGGSISLTGAATFGTAFTAASAGNATSVTVNVTGTTSGGMVVAAASFGNSSGVFTTTSGTQRWAINGDSNSGADNTVGGTWPSPGGTQAAGFSNTLSDFWGLAAVEVKASVAAPPAPPALLPLPPGWFPGAAAVTTDPGGIPFCPRPAPADATPAVIAPATPEAAGTADYLPLPPGWFPGSEKVASTPSGIPFAPVPPPLNPTPAVVFPVPETAGIADWLPLPPNWFPGASQVTTDPGSIPFYSLPQPLIPPPAPTGPAVITGLAGGGTGYFTDQYGNPRPFITTETWGLLVRAGLNSGGNWQGDIDTFFTQRAAQGFTVCMVDPVWGAHGTAYQGNTWDGLTPLAGGSQNPSTAGLNSTFWARTDYLMSSAAAHGITVGFVIYNTGDDHSTGDFYNTWTTAQWTDYGALIGGRYKNRANLIWLVGNDDFSPFSDSNFTAVKTGVTGAGDTHMWGAWYDPECTSRYITDTGAVEPWGRDNSSFNFCYSYNNEYWIIEYAYGEVANQGAANLLPVILGDGYFYQGTTTYSSTLDRALRQMWWWALASGARGVVGESEAVYPWVTGSAAAVTGDWFFANNAANIVTAYTGLAGWQNLIPDTGGALVTAGRGTRAAGRASGGGGGQYEPAFTNSYVAASITADGTLAVLYLPNATTITIDQTKLGSGYTATWIDPVTGATSSAATGTTYNSTAKGNNSQGNPDWALVFQGPPVSTTVTGTASLAGAGAVTAKVTEAPTAAVAGAGAVADVATQAVTAALPGAAAVSDVATEAPTASLAAAGAVADTPATEAVTAALAGAGAVTAAATQIAAATLPGLPAWQPQPPGWFPGADPVTDLPGGIPFYVVPQPTDQAAPPPAGLAIATASLAGAGSVAALVTEAVTAAAAGAGAVTGAVTQIATANLAGAGAVTTAVTEAAGANLAGAGSVTGVVTQAVTASLPGAGSVTDVVTEAVTANLAGAGSVTANAAGAGNTANLAAAGSVTAVATVIVTATAAGAGGVAAAVTQAAKATAAGAGTLSANGQITGTASLTGAGAVTGKAAQGVIAAPAAAGALAALAAQAATAALTAAGSVTATGGVQVAFTVGTLTASTTPGSSLTAATSSGGPGAAGTLTATTQRTGGPS